MANQKYNPNTEDLEKFIGGYRPFQWPTLTDPPFDDSKFERLMQLIKRFNLPENLKSDLYWISVNCLENLKEVDTWNTIANQNIKANIELRNASEILNAAFQAKGSVEIQIIGARDGKAKLSDLTIINLIDKYLRDKVPSLLFDKSDFRNSELLPYCLKINRYLEVVGKQTTSERHRIIGHMLLFSGVIVPKRENGQLGQYDHESPDFDEAGLCDVVKTWLKRASK